MPLEFAVTVEGQDQGYWVLDVDPVGERLLLALEDRVLRWVPQDTCRFLKMMNPDQPRAVIPVAPQTPLVLGSTPSLNLNGGR